MFFTNLGMLGMNVGLDVRVIDQIGLANPLAAHTARLEDGRIGHDKNLFPDWAVAEGPFLKEHPYIPPYLDEDWVAQAEAALKCPETEAMLTSIRGPLGPRRFLSNVLHACEFTSTGSTGCRSTSSSAAGCPSRRRRSRRTPAARDGPVTDAQRFAAVGVPAWLALCNAGAHVEAISNRAIAPPWLCHGTAAPRRRTYELDGYEQQMRMTSPLRLAAGPPSSVASPRC